MRITTIGAINEYTGSSVNPLNYPEQTYELYSVPSFDTGYPEIVKGADIGSTKVTVQEGDVLICKINPRINRVWVVTHHTKHQLLASSEWIVVRNSSIDSNYLKWYFSSPYFRILINSQVAGIGGSLTRAQPKQVAKYPVPVPDIEVQRHIVSVMERLSSLINLHKHQLAKLDELVKTRFVEWFGHPAMNSLGWELVKMNDCLLKIDGGKSLNCENFPRTNNYPAVLKLSAVTYGEYNPNENKQLPSPADFISSLEVHDGDLLFSRKNTYDYVGMTAFIRKTPPNLMLPDLIFRLTPSDRCLPVYLNCLFNHELFRPVIRELASGSSGSMPNISKNRLLNLSIPLPPLDSQNHFATFMERTNESKSAIRHSIEKLETLKVSLMQEYFR